VGGGLNSDPRPTMMASLATLVSWACHEYLRVKNIARDSGKVCLPGKASMEMGNRRTMGRPLMSMHVRPQQPLGTHAISDLK
jgi:hypothetical protein